MVVLDVRHRYPADMGDRYDAIPRDYPQSDWDTYQAIPHRDDGFAHCDSDVLHRPGRCAACDLYPGLQHERIRHRIAFTGEPPLVGETACPADVRRPNGANQVWSGNRPAMRVPPPAAVPPVATPPVSAPRRRWSRVRAAFARARRHLATW